MIVLCAGLAAVVILYLEPIYSTAVSNRSPLHVFRVFVLCVGRETAYPIAEQGEDTS